MSSGCVRPSSSTATPRRSVPQREARSTGSCRRAPAPTETEALDLLRADGVLVERPRQDEVLDVLTAREREVFLLVAKGLSNQEIASSVFLSEATVKSHVRAVLTKLGLRNRIQVVITAHERGLVRS